MISTRGGNYVFLEDSDPAHKPLTFYRNRTIGLLAESNPALQITSRMLYLWNITCPVIYIKLLVFKLVILKAEKQNDCKRNTGIKRESDLNLLMNYYNKLLSIIFKKHCLSILIYFLCLTCICKSKYFKVQRANTISVQ